MIFFKKIFYFILRILISVALLWFLFAHQVDFKNALAIIKNADIPLLFYALLVSSLGYALCFWRWKLLIKAIGIKAQRLRVIAAFSGGLFYNFFLPSTIGGDVMRTVDLAAHTQKGEEVVATVFLDRLSGYFGLVALSFLALGLGWRLLENSSVLIAMGVIVVVLVALLLVMFNSLVYNLVNRFLRLAILGNLGKKLMHVHSEIHYFKQHKKAMLESFLISFLVQCVAPLSSYLIGLAIGIKVSLIYYFVFIPIVGAISLLPVSIGGLGLRENSTVFFFSQAGVSKDVAGALSLINFSFLVFIGFIGGLIYVFTLRYRRIQPASSSRLSETGSS